LSDKNTDSNALPDAQEVFSLLSDLSGALLKWSEEGISGMEEMIMGVGEAYGYKDITVLFSPQSVLLSMSHQVTLLRTELPGLPELSKVTALRHWHNDILASKLSVEAARTRLQQILTAPSLYATPLVILGAMLFSAALAFDFVGTWEGVIVGALTGILGAWCFVGGKNIRDYPKIMPLVASLLVSFCVIGAWKLGWLTGSPGLLLIPGIFLFIPGDTITVQALELAEGHWDAAVDRLAYSVGVFILLIFGVLISATVLGVPFLELVPTATASIFPWWVIYPSYVVVTIGMMLVLQMRRADLLLAILTIIITTIVAQIVTSLASNELAGTFAGAIAMTLVAKIIAINPQRSPAYVYMVIPFFTLTPGTHGLSGLEGLISGQSVSGVTDLGSLFTNLLALSLGIFIASMIWRQFQPLQPTNQATSRFGKQQKVAGADASKTDLKGDPK
jgi:uncharacterized membrane protein YjjP (DUF1212 family)